MVNIASRTKKHKAPSRGTHKRSAAIAITSDDKLNSGDKLIGLALMFVYDNTETGRCFPSLTTLCRDMQLDRSNVAKSRNKLKARGHLTWDVKKPHKGQKTCFYTFPKVVVQAPPHEAHGSGTDTPKGSGTDATQTQKINTEVKRERRLRATPAPADDVFLSDRQYHIAVAAGIQGREKADTVFQEFIDYYRANGKCFVDWDAQWRMWLRKQPQFDAMKAKATKSRNSAGEYCEKMADKYRNDEGYHQRHEQRMREEQQREELKRAMKAEAKAEKVAAERARFAARYPKKEQVQ